jgi:hypothetical protein
VAPLPQVLPLLVHLPVRPGRGADAPEAALALQAGSGECSHRAAACGEAAAGVACRPRPSRALGQHCPSTSPHPIATQTPECLATQDDCIVTSIPCVGICTNCQETRELAARGVVAGAPLAPTEFNWNAFAPEVTAATASAAATQAPAAQEMK